VDTETEFRVREALSRMVEGRTSLIIAHRLSTIQRADKIIVMHKGKVREMGTHRTSNCSGERAESTTKLQALPVAVQGPGVVAHLPLYRAAAVDLHERHPELHFSLPVASTISRAWLAELIGKLSTTRPSVALPLELVADARQALASSHAAVVASGTATLEAALAGTPFVMVYRLTALTWLMGRRLVDVPFFCIVNLIAGREVVPELVQQDFTPVNVAARIERLLADGPERRQMLDGLREVRARLSVAAGASASVTAAQEILKVIQLERGRTKTEAVPCTAPDTGI
jgi:lipid A disaccharide synthetase